MESPTVPNYAKTIIALSIVLLLTLFVTVIYLPGRIDDVRGDTEQLVKAGVDKAMVVAASNKSPATPDLAPQVVDLKETVEGLQRQVQSFEAGLADRDRTIADLRLRMQSAEQQVANAVTLANAATNSARAVASQPAQAAPVYTPPPAQQYVPPPTPLPIVPQPAVAPAGPMVVTVDSWRFEVKRVTLSEATATVSVVLTSLDEDTEVLFSSRGAAYDQQGREMGFSGGVIGGKNTPRSLSKGRFVQGVPSEISLKFTGANSKTTHLAALDIVFQLAGTADRKVAKFRNVPITR